MRKMFLAVFLIFPAPVFAGPPERASGKTILIDPVRDALRQYRRERDPQRRITWLKEWAPIKDPRVAVALGEASKSDDLDVSHQAIRLVFENYELPPSEDMGAPPIRGLVFQWWRANEADLRRRAKLLPE